MPFNKKDFINPIHIFLAIVIVAIVWFAPVTNTPKQSTRTEKPTLLEYASSPRLILAVPEVEAGCPSQCQIKVCVDWDPNPCGSKPWDIGCCMAYATECDPECDVEPPPPDDQPPAISHVLTCSQNGSNGWCIGNLNLNLSASDPQGSQVIISGDVNGTPFICPIGNTTCSISFPEGTGSISYRVDAATTGLFATGTTSYLLDTSTPQLSGLVSGVTGANGWYKSSVTFAVAASDSISGIASTEMTMDGGAQTEYLTPIVLSDGIHTVILTATDNAGNVTQTVQTFSIDTITPVLNVSLSGTMGLNNWYVSNVIVAPSASDSGSGVVLLETSIDGSAYTNYQSPITFSDGVHSYQFRATDGAGNVTETIPQTVQVDTTTPTISLSVRGTRGQNDWYVSDADVTPIAGDGGSGVGLFEARVGDRPWTMVNGPLSFSDGIHRYQLKATDNAGNVTEIPPQQIKIDTVFPVIAMAGELKLGETLYFDLEDPVIRSSQVSGLWINRHVIEDDDEKYKKLTWQEIISGEKFHGEILWDGVFADGTKAKAGDYFITLKVSDAAGNETMQSVIAKVNALSYLQIIPPFILPVEAVTSDEFADPPVLSDSTFGGANNGAIGEVSSLISAGGIITHHHETEFMKSGFMQGNQSTSTPITNPNILWGAVATAVLGATLAEWQRRREEEEARKRAETAPQEKEGGSGKQTPGQRAYEKMMRQKRIVGESQALLNEKTNRKEAVYIPNQKLEDEETNWLKKLNPVYQYEQRKLELQKKVELQAGLSAYYEGRKAGEEEAKEIEKPSLLEKAIDWVDKNQPDASMGAGVIVGLAAIAVTLAIVGTVTLPVLLAAAGIAAITAGATVAAGTLALNLHYDRPSTTNIWENVQAAAITAAVVSGIGLFVAGGLLTQATVFAGNAIAGTCASNPTLCANAGTVLNVVDTLEESSLALKLAVETALGNPQAGETAIELQLEQMDGGLPGNSVAAELSELGEDALAHGDEVVEFLQKGYSAADDWTKYIPENFQDDVKSGFDGDPVAVTLNENVSIYRYWSDISAESGRWTTLNPNLSPEEARAVLALPNENYAYSVTQFVIPKNTTVLVGRVAEQTSAEWSGAFAIGGGFQIFVPDDNVLIGVPLLSP